ncbi:MAG: hypothetical protein R3182_14405, partial [Draconibacterium sp.]|nr:hypothetical protein [Draconibacterium sp.]
LGADFTSEHEWGIKKMRELFGIPESSKKTMGIKSRTISKCPENLLFKRDGDSAVLWVAYVDWHDKIREELPSEIARYKDSIKWEEKWYKERKAEYDKSKKKDKYLPEKKDPMVTAWDEGTFGVAVVGKKESDWLEFLYEQFKKKNIAIAMMNMHPGNPFSNASLTLAILDRLPEEVTDLMYAADKKYYDLQDYEKKIGMTKLKEKVLENQRKKSRKDPNYDMYKALHYYMACSAKWINYEDAAEREELKKKYKTKYDIHYWINYSDDDDNCGWYTVEEIKAWLTGDKKLTEVAPRKED